MSVPEPERHKGRLEVHVKAQALATYTATILKNTKVFDPDVDQELISRIRNCAYDIYIKSWQANKIRADTNGINRIMRYNLQEEAILLCDEIHASKGDGWKMLKNMDRYYKELWRNENAENHQADVPSQGRGGDQSFDC